MSFLLSLPECKIPQSPLCSACSSLEITLGVCPVLAPTKFEEVIGAVTGWTMYLCFLFPLFLFIRRKTSVVWLSFTPYISGLFSSTAIKNRDHPQDNFGELNGSFMNVNLPTPLRTNSVFAPTPIRPPNTGEVPDSAWKYSARYTRPASFFL